MKRSRYIISHATAHVRWYLLAYLYGLIFTCIELFIEQTLHPYMPDNLPLTVVSVVLVRPAVFIVVARWIVALRKGAPA